MVEISARISEESLNIHVHGATKPEIIRALKEWYGNTTAPKENEQLIVTLGNIRLVFYHKGEE